MPQSLADTAVQAFKAQFAAAPTHLARAPGRVNLIGEHTDYNDGFVLPAAIDYAIYIAGRVRSDDQVRIQSLDYRGEATFRLDALRDDSLPHWTRYPRGVLWITREEGYALRGMDLTIVGNVPLGAGFSSSAAVEVAMFEIVSALLGFSIPQKQKALLGQQVEHRFIGIRCGIMDQMISACGEADHALLIDCRSLDLTSVPVPRGVSLVALDTGKRRELATHGKYNERVQECNEAARLLGVQSLRDATPDLLAARAKDMPDVVARRAMHVIHENARTLAVVEALRRDDLPTVGRLLNEGHASLRDLYEVSIRELDIMAELAQREPGCYGARMMGGGFGGAVIALVDDAAVDSMVARVTTAYQDITGLRASAYVAKASPGSSAQML